MEKGIDGETELLHQFLKWSGLPEGPHSDARAVDSDIALPIEPCRLFYRDSGSYI
jgi:hypothetical protein